MPLPEQVAAGVAGWVVMEGAVLMVTVTAVDVAAGVQVPLITTS